MARRQNTSNYPNDDATSNGYPYGSSDRSGQQNDSYRDQSPYGQNASYRQNNYRQGNYQQGNYQQDNYQQGNYRQGNSYQQGNYQQRSSYQEQTSYRQQGNSYQQNSPYQQGRSYQQGDPYQQGSSYQQSSPYQQGNSYQQRSPYQQDSPYDNRGQGRSAAGSGRSNQQASYPVGSGRAYESSRQQYYGGAVPPSGEPPINVQTYESSPYDYSGGGSGGRGPSVSRRRAITIAGCAAVVAVLAVAGVGWYTHRSVACTINGIDREAQVGSSVEDIIALGYVYPRYGNLVAISVEGETPEVLVSGGGNPYTLEVNGEMVNVDDYRLREYDELIFTNGTDVIEDTIVENTEIPCGVQYPDTSFYLATIGYVAQWGRNGVSTVETGTVSGRVIDRGVTQEPEDLIIAKSGINPDDGRKLVAITFDDGPEVTYTPQYLDILARYGAKATFFNIGYAIEWGSDYAALSRRCIEEGHQVASHTYSHEDLTAMSAEAAIEDIDHGFEVVEEATGVPTNVLRAPYGNYYGYNFYDYLRSGRDLACTVYWTIDSNDWQLLGVDTLINAVAGGVSEWDDSYNGAVILMHDGGGNRDQDVAALPTILERFTNAGYQFVTLNELIASDSTFPEWVSSGYAVRPDWAVIP